MPGLRLQYIEYIKYNIKGEPYYESIGQFRTLGDAYNHLLSSGVLTNYHIMNDRLRVKGSRQSRPLYDLAKEHQRRYGYLTNVKQILDEHSEQ